MCLTRLPFKRRRLGPSQLVRSCNPISITRASRLGGSGRHVGIAYDMRPKEVGKQGALLCDWVAERGG